MDFVDEANSALPNHIYSAPNIKICASFYMPITTGTLVLIRQHMKTDLATGDEI